MPRYAKHPIKGYENLYWITKDGRVFNSQRELKQFKSKQGYMKVGLYKNKKSKSLFVHRLLLLTFVPNPDNKPFCNHKNSVRHDNHLPNLEWCTHAENMAHGAIANRARKRKIMEDIRKMLDKSHKQYIREHPKEYAESQRLFRGVIDLPDINLVPPPMDWGLGRGFATLLPQGFSSLPDDSKKSVDIV